MRVVETGELSALDFRFEDYHLGLLTAAELEDLYAAITEHARSRANAARSDVARYNLGLIELFLAAYESNTSGDFVRITREAIPDGGYIRGGPPVAAGYTRRFEFGRDYVSFFENEMDGISRMIGYTGGWRMQGPFLVVDLWAISTLSGGRFEPGRFASIGTEWVLTEARFETTIVPEDAHYILRLPISALETRAMFGTEIPFVRIAGLPYGRVYD